MLSVYVSCLFYCLLFFSGRHFHLYLYKKMTAVAPGFRVVMVDGKNNEREVKLELKNFYKGYGIGKKGFN